MADNRPDTKSAAHKLMAPDWGLVRALQSETRGMRDAGTTYLPQWPNEHWDHYLARLNSSYLYDGYARTINGLTGKVTRKNLVVGEDVPSQVADLLPNIDLTGRDVNAFVREYFHEGLGMGQGHILVDTTGQGTAKTKAEEKAQGVRPFWQLVRPENLLYAGYVVVNGVPTLTDVRIREAETVADGWGDKTVERVRRFELTSGGVAWTLWEKNGEGKWYIADSATSPIQRIPLVTFYGQRLGFMRSAPPLMGVAWLNLAHWQSASEQRHVLALARRPVLGFFGFKKDEVESLHIGPHTGLRSTNADSRIEFAEITGASIDAGRQDLQDLKEEMATLGLEVLVRKSVEKTATESSNEKHETESQLGAIAKDCEDSINEALQLTAEWMKLADGGTVMMNSEFGFTAATQVEVQALIEARRNREISWNTFATEMQRRGILDEGLDLEEERALLEQEAANL
jgi:hypothetical protein